MHCVNECGQWLVSTRNWRWLRGGLEALSLVSGQPYVDLPNGIGAIIAVDGGQGFPYSFEQTTLEEILRMRSVQAQTTGIYYFASITYEHADIAGTSTGTNHVVTPNTAAETHAKKHPTPRLELYPTPGQTVADGVLLYYQRGWRTVYEDTDTIFVPEWLQGPYLRALRIWAQGYEYSVGSGQSYDKDMALAKLVAGDEWRAAVSRDSALQNTLGRLQGGAAQRGRRWNSGRWPPGQVVGP